MNHANFLPTPWSLIFRMAPTKNRRSIFDAHVPKKGGRCHGIAARRHMARLRREFREKAAKAVENHRDAELRARVRQGNLQIENLEGEKAKALHEQDQLRTEVGKLRTAQTQQVVLSGH